MTRDCRQVSPGNNMGHRDLVMSYR